jgi:acetate kinase
MNVLVINCGSSSLKFQLRRIAPGAAGSGEGRLLGGGLIQGIGGTAEVTLRRPGAEPERSRAEAPDYAAAVRIALDWLARSGIARPGNGAGTGGDIGREIDAAGHRFVHGGERLHEPARIDAAVRRELRVLEELAPLHNRPSLAGVDAVQAALGEGLPQVAVFDTAFHHGLPEVARTYGLPHALAARHGIRRYGFHGTSCRSVLERYGELPGAVPAGRVIILHLGSGCSATAVRGGRAVDTSMGFTPLEGLLMGTRSGDLDPALPMFLASREGLSLEAVEHLLNEASGLKGLSGRSNDLRELLAHEGEDERARLAVELFCYRVRKYIGAYLAVLEGADAVLFAGGVGEHLPSIRARICGPLAWCGLRLDAARNEAARGEAPCPIGATGAPVQAFVIPSDEERIIAWDTARCLAAGPG